jgi:bacterioferritin (cytochrome b1)
MKTSMATTSGKRTSNFCARRKSTTSMDLLKSQLAKDKEESLKWLHVTPASS